MYKQFEVPYYFRYILISVKELLKQNCSQNIKVVFIKTKLKLTFKY